MPNSVRCQWRTRYAVAILLVIHSGLVAWEAWRCSPTIDEVAHLPAGLSHWKFGRFDLYRVNPPLVRMLAAVPLLFLDPKTDWSAYNEAPYARPEFSIGTAFTKANGTETFWHFTLARWACIPLSLTGAWICYRWARDLSGGPAGLFALTLWCFCPNILGNGALITPDAGAAAMGVAAGYCFWRWLREACWTHTLLAGLTLGLAELTKSTWIVLFGLWPALWVLWIAANRNAAGTFSVASEMRPGKRAESTPSVPFAGADSTPSWHIQFLQLVGILIIALYALNLGYGFEDSLRRLGRFQFISRTLGGAKAHEVPGNRFLGTWLGTLPVPVPANYLIGIDVQRHDFEKGKWSYLHGEQKMGGWWYYYLYALVVKVPVGTLAFLVLAAVLSARRLFSRGCRAWRDNFVVLAPAVAVLVLVSSQTGFNRYLRYVLPIFPFLFVWMSQAAQLLAPVIANRHPPSRECRGEGGDRSAWCHNLRLSMGDFIPLVLLSSVASSLAVFPHSLSYFNELAGGPHGGPTHLLDANIDWGQDLLELQRWHHSYPDAQPFHLAYFGFIDARLAGLEFKPVPGMAANERSMAMSSCELGPVPGWHAISVNELYGYKHFGNETDQYAYMRHVRPVASIGYSIMIYHFVLEDANRLRRTLGLDTLPQPSSELPSPEMK